MTLALLLPLAGCGGGQEAAEETHSEEAEHEETEHAGEEHEAEEGVLVVDPEVLRDLKLTTFPAELRPGGEGGDRPR